MQITPLNSAMSSGLHGFYNAEKRSNEVAQQIATLNTSSGNNVQLENELVELKTAELEAEAATKVIATSNEMVGTLVDLKI